jgi:branched-chain amino acid transport system ATP-binding protein
VSILALHGLTQRFGGLVAVKDLDFQIEEGTIVAMIGPNGAGKSTVFNVITGIYRPTAGSVEFNGKVIQGRKTSDIAALGIARTFQNIRLFAFMSALDNVMTGRHSRMRATLADALIRTPFAVREEQLVRERALEILRFCGLERDAHSFASNLPYGAQRRLEIARALAGDPKLLLLDEPAAGMNPIEKDELIGLIRRIRESGVTIFLIEHDMGLVMRISERIAVLDYGEKIAEGPPEAIRTNERVIEAYLGKPA